MAIWKVSFTVFALMLFGIDKFVGVAEADLSALGVSEPVINLVQLGIGHTYDTLAAIALAILGISNLPFRVRKPDPDPPAP